MQKFGIDDVYLVVFYVTGYQPFILPRAIPVVVRRVWRQVGHECILDIETFGQKAV